ncbi:MAG: hypothetical protein LBI30_03130 [Holosporales bacterium]|nr:hypothetical protein [Holosporales bacterium]
MLFYNQLMYKRPGLNFFEIVFASVYVDFVGGSFCGSTLIGVVILSFIVNALSMILYDAGLATVYFLFFVILVCVLAALNYFQILLGLPTKITSEILPEFLFTMALYPAAYLFLFSQGRLNNYA